MMIASMMRRVRQSIGLAALAVAILFTAARPALAQSPAATRPAENGWQSKWFSYNRPTTLPVEETTPTPAQVSFRIRPPQMKGDMPAPVASTKPAKPFLRAELSIVHLRFRDALGSDVSALLTTPAGKKAPFPVVIAVHGLTSSASQVTAQVAPTLAKRGFAILALDMPLHGERPGSPGEFLDRTDLQAFFGRFQQAVVDIRQCIDMAESRPELDTKSGVIYVGYSMGSVIGSLAGPADDRIKAMVLMVGGSPEFQPALALIPQLRSLEPPLGVVHFSPRPLLMLNAKNDRVVTPEMATRLFEAAAEPKKQVWYDSGHLLPAKAYEDAAQWVGETWGGMRPSPAR